MVIKPPRPRPHRKSDLSECRPARKGVAKITPKSKTPKKPVIFTSTEEGTDLGLIDTWKDLAASESRLELMRKLKILNLGLAEVEEFNLGLNLNFRTEKARERMAKGENKFVTAAMESKLMDEIYKNSEIMRTRNKMRRKLAEDFGKNTRRYNSIIKHLRTEARIVENEYRAKYKRSMRPTRRTWQEEKTG